MTLRELRAALLTAAIFLFWFVGAESRAYFFPGYFIAGAEAAVVFDKPFFWEVQMAEPEIIVSSTIRLRSAQGGPFVEALRAGQEVSVELEGGRRATLLAQDPRSAGFAEILRELQELRRPVYLEVDRETKAISRLLVPDVTRILSITPSDNDGLNVELYFSQGRHLLRRDQRDFAKFEEILRHAAKTGQLVIVSEDDAHNIVDVRAFQPGPEGAPLLPFPEPQLIPEKWPPSLQPLPKPHIPWGPWPIGCISKAKALQIFNAVAATTCNPVAVPPPCIPFLYPDDGCWGRAHEMCRLMINMGLSPRKVWIQGNLKVKTKNNPNCQVFWGWHVAPTLRVRGKWFFLCETMVIDPSLFMTPVTEATWKGVQGDINATLTPSDPSIFYLWGNLTDPTYAQTNQVLATYRLKLKARSLQVGPPPYANCA